MSSKRDQPQDVPLGIADHGHVTVVGPEALQPFGHFVIGIQEQGGIQGVLQTTIPRRLNR